MSRPGARGPAGGEGRQARSAITCGGPGGYSDVILRLASATVAAQKERPPRGGLSDVEL